jgi:cystathionine beta-lyase
MNYDFDKVIDRSNSDSSKWHYYAEDALPLWTADMDFRCPEPVIQALRSRVEHGIFGYGMEPPGLRDAIVERLKRLYGWRIQPDEIVFPPGVVVGFNRVCHAAASPGDGVLIQPPVYPPMLAAPAQHDLVRQEAELRRMPDGRYEIDFASFEAAITDRTRVFILCNPHNPVGRAFLRPELERMAEICLRKNVLICSDEIHCDILFSNSRHIPIASLDPEVARRTVTLLAPSKTFNVPGLHCSIAIVPDPSLRRKMVKSESPYFSEINVLGYTAALAAYRDGQEWLGQLLRYLEGNRDLVFEFLSREFPNVKMHKPEATYLAWLDCSNAGIPGNPFGFFLQKARVALFDGCRFGTGGEGFVRLNFGCPRSTLVQALERMKAAMAALKSF